MVKLRLFSAAFPWQCELLDVKCVWSFGFSTQSDHQLPKQLLNGHTDLLEIETLFTLKGLGDGQWEITCAERPKKLLKSFPLMLNGMPLQRSIFNDSDILTLGDQGHILVSISGQRAPKKSISQTSLGEKGSKSQKKTAPLNPKSEPVGRLATESAKKAICSIAQKVEPPKKTLPLEKIAKNGSQRNASQDAVADQVPQKGRLLGAITLLTLFIFTAWLYVVKVPDFEKDLIKPHSTTNDLFDDRPLPKSYDELPQRASGVPQTPISDAWSKMPNPPSQIIEQVPGQMLQRDDLLVQSDDLAGSKVALPSAPINHNPSQDPSQDPLPEKANLRLEKRAMSKTSCIEDLRSIEKGTFAQMTPLIVHSSSVLNWDYHLHALAGENRLIRWLGAIWSPLSAKITSHPKPVERSLMLGQLRQPIGPPITKVSG